MVLETRVVAIPYQSTEGSSYQAFAEMQERAWQILLANDLLPLHKSIQGLRVLSLATTSPPPFFVIEFTLEVYDD